jgi:hypothetical protein
MNGQTGKLSEHAQHSSGTCSGVAFQIKRKKMSRKILYSLNVRNFERGKTERGKDKLHFANKTY